MINVLVGTRAEIIKQTPVIEELRRRGECFRVIHTNQHYDDCLSMQFFRDLSLPLPDVELNIGSGTHGEQTGKALIAIEKELMSDTGHGEGTNWILVQGDTNTVLAGALACSKIDGIRTGHVEAGLRSYDLRMPEEYNRRLTDHMSDYLFAPTEGARGNLEKEDVTGKVYVTGNTVIDAVERFLPLAEKKSVILEKARFSDFVLATFHRQENVDNPEVLHFIVKLLAELDENFVFPIHPRTVKTLKRYNMFEDLKSRNNIDLIDPVGYLDFLKLMKSCKYIITDSGGIQEEATAPALNRRVFVFRKCTERPEAVDSGHAVVIGTESEEALRKIKEGTGKKPAGKLASPFGDGHAGRRIVDVITSI
jgi:UDP-N-acetylglucosamine 2-epimerase (non-hydrolysing)